MELLHTNKPWVRAELLAGDSTDLLDSEPTLGLEHYLTTYCLYIYAPDADVVKLTKFLSGLTIPYYLNAYHINLQAGDKVYIYNRLYLSNYQQQFVLQLIQQGLQVGSFSCFLDHYLQYTDINLLTNEDFLNQNFLATLNKPIAKRFIRLLDIILASFLLFLSFPILFFAAIAIKLESKGNIIYKQKRTGLYNQEFEILKFRSMRADAEQQGAQWSSKQDSRITRVGNVIRKTRIDELPQLINVLKGEMSVIGPRPEREIFIKELEQVIPFYRCRHLIKPGITGLAQVSFGYGASVSDAVHKHRYDVFYLKHRSLWLDIKILFRTIKTVILGQGL
jgi:exopolysaccharide biosynthesis polyprenyl glycosylphosphotransferase